MAKRKQPTQEDSRRQVRPLRVGGDDSQLGQSSSKTARSGRPKAQLQAKRQNPLQRPTAAVEGEKDTESAPHASQMLQTSKDSASHDQKDWTSLSSPTLKKAKELFRTLEHEVLDRQNGGSSSELPAKRQRTLAQGIINEMTEAIDEKITKTLFPPGSTVDGLINGASSAKRGKPKKQLLNTTASIGELRVEIEKQEALLKRESNQLKTLRANARSANAERRRLASKIHPAIRDLEREELSQVSDTDHSRGTSRFLVKQATEATSLSELGRDPALRPLLQKLRRHLEAMRKQSSQTEELQDAIRRGRAALLQMESNTARSRNL